MSGTDEHGQPANVGAGLDEHNRLVLISSAREVHLDPETAGEYQKILREVNVEGWLQT